MPANVPQSTGDFLSHRPSDQRGNFLETDWHKKNGGKLSTFMHKAVRPIDCFRHSTSKIVVVENKDTGNPERKVWTEKFICPESDEVLSRQYFSDKKTKEPSFNPEVCGTCRLLAWIWREIWAGRIGWTQTLFRFIGDGDPKFNSVVHAGGLLGQFSGKLEPAEKEACKRAGIVLDEAWKENWRAKPQALAFVVDADRPSKGLLRAWIQGTLSDKIKDLVADQMESKGLEAGDPFLNPYCIQWIYDEQIKQFNKYRVRAMESVKPSEAILQIISGSPPDYESLIRPIDQRVVRDSIMQAALPDFRKLVPWEEIFGKGEASKAKEKVKEAEPQADDDMVGCDDCKKPIRLTDPKCPHCGKVYEVAQEPVAPPPPVPPMRTRSQVAAERRETEARRPTATASSAEQEDDIPF